MASSSTACPECGLEYSGGEVFCPNDGARLAPKHDSSGHPVGRRSQADALIGQTLGGRYRIIRKIGEGGMGIVYEAEHVVIEKRVGLKVLREDFSSRPDVVERFRQEAKSASRIGHEHIIDISDFGETGQGASFFVMELLNGHDLAEELEKIGPLSPRRTISIALQCAKALGAAHAKGIVHRDMKPENIFLVKRDSGEDFVKIVDFGIAKMSDIETDGQPGRKLTKTGMIFGTPEYMSPEQAGGKKLDHRVDIYAMGVIMYELLTGRVPFMGDTFMGILTQHMFEQAPPLKTMNPSCTVPPELERIVFRALAKNADERYQSMEELANELAGALTRAPSSVASISPPPGTITHHGYQEQVAAQPRNPQLLVSTEATEFPNREKKSGALVWAGVGALMVALAGGAAWFTHKSAPPAIAATPAPVAKVVAPPAAAPVAPAPAAPTPTEPPKVFVEVQTEPAGATVKVDGREACNGTPCRFSTERDVIVKVEADKPGYRTSSTEVKPSAEINQVQLVLRKRVSREPRERTGTRHVGDLKIPDAFGPR